MFGIGRLKFKICKEYLCCGGDQSKLQTDVPTKQSNKRGSNAQVSPYDVIPASTNKAPKQKGAWRDKHQQSSVTWYDSFAGPRSLKYGR